MPKTTEPKEDTQPVLTEEQIAARRAALTAELDALPAPEVKGIRPGTIVGEGLAADRIPFNAEWYMDVEARKKDPEFGPSYQLHEIFPSETINVGVNGVWFGLYAGRKCWLPTPHYMVYMDRLKTLRDNDERFTVPPGGPQPMVVYRIDGQWVKTPIE